MTNLTLLGIAGLIIFAIARYNRSNKLFWQLLMSFVFGFACAHGGSKLVEYGTKKDSTTISVPMHQSPMTIDSISNAVMPSTDTRVPTNDAGKDEIDRDMVCYAHIEPSAPLEENKGDPPSYLDTS